MLIAQIRCFAIVGVAGLIVDASVLHVLLFLGRDFYSARVVSFLCAVWLTWRLNRRFTFGIAKDATRSEWWRYLCAMGSGGAVNYAVYAAMVAALPLRWWLPLAAVCLGSLSGMAVNFATAKWWVFAEVVTPNHLSRRV